MATQLRIKRGTTNANAPSGLTAGEMAINLVDKKLYVGGTAGTNVIFLDSTSSVGLGTANTFKALQSFSAGISASGATFSSPITIPINTAPAITIGNAASHNLTLGSIDSAGEIVQTGNPSGTLNIRQEGGGIVSIGDYLGSGNVTYISVEDVDSTINIDAAIINTGVLSANGYILSSSGIQAKTASYSLVAADNGKIITMNVASANTLTVPASLDVGFNCTIIQLGAGQTTITASGTTLNSYQGYLKISGQHGSASIVGYASNVYNVAGNLSA